MASTAYDIRLLLDSDILNAITLIRDHYIHEETIYRSFLEHNRGNYCRNVYSLITHSLSKFLCRTVFKTQPAFIAVDKADRSVVGLVLMHFGEFRNLKYRRDCRNWPTATPDGIFQKLTYYLWNIHENADVLVKFPNARHHIYFMYLTVRSDHRRRGVGTALVQRAMQWAKEHRFDLAYGIFTSAPSKKIAERVGMRSIFDCDLRAVRSVEDEVVFDDAGVNNIVSVMAVELKPIQENEVSMTN